MVAPHWNPKATEITIVTEGEGIVQTVCPSSSPSSAESKKKSRRRGGRHGHEERHEWGEPGGGGDEGHGSRSSSCRSSVFRVKEGDVFVVPRFHPMAQMSFNNDSFVFVGFSTLLGQNHPRFLAGKQSVLRAVGKEVLALALGQRNTSAVEQLLAGQRDSTILSCISCSEELEEKAAEERKQQEEEEGGGGKGPSEREEEDQREREERERKERKEEEQREREERDRKEREEEDQREREGRERKEQEEDQREREERERNERKEEEQRREQEEQQRTEKEERLRAEEERRRQEEKERGGRRKKAVVATETNQGWKRVATSRRRIACPRN
jgi:hypothetical protein